MLIFTLATACALGTWCSRSWRREKRLMVDLSLRDVIDVTLALKNYLLEKWHRKHHASASPTNSPLYFFSMWFSTMPHSECICTYLNTDKKYTYELPRAVFVCAGGGSKRVISFFWQVNRENDWALRRNTSLLVSLYRGECHIRRGV